MSFECCVNRRSNLITQALKLYKGKNAVRRYLFPSLKELQLCQEGALDYMPAKANLLKCSY